MLSLQMLDPNAEGLESELKFFNDIKKLQDSATKCDIGWFTLLELELQKERKPL